VEDGGLHLLDDALEGADLSHFSEHGGSRVFSVWCVVFGRISGDPNTKSPIKSMVQPYLGLNGFVKPNIGLNGQAPRVIQSVFLIDLSTAWN
jgi:hypothetical protein